MSTIPFQSDDGDQIKQQMQVVRHEIQEDAEQLADSTRQLTQWREYVRAHPWLCLGGAAALGAVLAPSRRQPASAHQSTGRASGGSMMSFIGATVGRAAIGVAIQFVIDQMTNQMETSSNTDTMPFEESFNA